MKFKSYLNICSNWKKSGKWHNKYTK